MGDHKMKKYQEALNYLAKAQKIIEDLAKDESEEKNNNYKQPPPDRRHELESLVLSVLSRSAVPLSARDMGKTCRKIRRASSSKKEEILEKMVSYGLIGSKKTSKTVKYFVIGGN